MKLSIQHNSLILQHKCAFSWCAFSLQFNTPFCYSSVSSVKKINFKSKGKTILSQATWSFFCILCQMDIHFKRLVISQSGITMNISNTRSVTVLSNFQFTLIFSVLKKSCKNECICPSDMSIRHNYFFKH